MRQVLCKPVLKLAAEFSAIFFARTKSMRFWRAFNVHLSSDLDLTFNFHVQLDVLGINMLYSDPPFTSLGSHLNCVSLTNETAWWKYFSFFIISIQIMILLEELSSFLFPFLSSKFNPTILIQGKVEQGEKLMWAGGYREYVQVRSEAWQREYATHWHAPIEGSST